MSIYVNVELLKYGFCEEYHIYAVDVDVIYEDVLEKLEDDGFEKEVDENEVYDCVEAFFENREYQISCDEIEDLGNYKVVKGFDIDDLVELDRFLINTDIPLGVIECVLDDFSFSNVSDMLEYFEDCMIISASSKSDLAWTYLNEMTGMIDELPEWAKNYFDYESYGNDLAYDFVDTECGYFISSY